MGRDPEKQRQAKVRHYEANKVKIKQRAKRWQRKQILFVQKFVFEYLKTNPCVDCGESDPIVLQFDHEDASTKRLEVSVMCNGSYGLDSVISEIEKCSVRCANCHQRKTYKERGCKHRGAV